ncbi:MAG: hypothetical protein AB1609_16430 [Bacillota bacterium]
MTLRRPDESRRYRIAVPQNGWHRLEEWAMDALRCPMCLRKLRWQFVYGGWWGEDYWAVFCPKHGDVA